MPLTPINPARPPATDPDARTAGKIAELERRIRTLESYLQGGATQQVPVVQGLPAAGRKGRLVILNTDGKLYRDSGASWVAIG